MLNRVLACGVVGLIASGASAQLWCSPSQPAQPRTVFTPVNRGHNFIGTPSRAPRRAFGIDRNPLLLEQSVNITPGRQSFTRGGQSGQVAVVGGSGREFFDGSSVRIRGDVSGDNFDLRVNIGADAESLVRGSRDLKHKDPEFCPPVHRPIYPGYYPGIYPWSWGYTWAYDYNRPRYPVDGALVVYTNQTQTTAQQPEETVAEEPLTEPQRAALLLRAGEVEASIDALRSYLLTEEGDAEAMRLLALALAVDGQIREAAATMSFAYDHDRSMAHRPLGAANVEDGARTLRDALRDAVQFAHREDSASAWFLVAVLMQAEGRDELSGTMLERSFTAGLDRQVYDAMNAAVGG